MNHSRKSENTELNSKTIRYLMLAVAAGAVLTALFRYWYHFTKLSIFLSLFVTFLTTTYHFSMRIMVGIVIAYIYRNKSFNYESFWFREKRFEKKLYSMIKVKKWKSKAMTAQPKQFDITANSCDQLLHNITQAEVVHELIMLLSFVPLLWIRRFGAPAAFILTSVMGCLIDLKYVLIQRYNRPRVLILKHKADAANLIVLRKTTI